mmetsp:Transcript_39587/g.93722  ORF Transcript_39587/g.93722 Transcript_39587/m.93722 type:complete len:208 (+) Transcript_39587:103-726(+)
MILPCLPKDRRCHLIGTPPRTALARRTIGTVRSVLPRGTRRMQMDRTMMVRRPVGAATTLTAWRMMRLRLRKLTTSLRERVGAQPWILGMQDPRQESLRRCMGPYRSIRSPTLPTTRLTSTARKTSRPMLRERMLLSLPSLTIRRSGMVMTPHRLRLPANRTGRLPTTMLTPVPSISAPQSSCTQSSPWHPTCLGHRAAQQQQPLPL